MARKKAAVIEDAPRMGPPKRGRPKKKVEPPVVVPVAAPVPEPEPVAAPVPEPEPVAAPVPEPPSHQESALERENRMLREELARACRDIEALLHAKEQKVALPSRRTCRRMVLGIPPLPLAAHQCPWNIVKFLSSRKHATEMQGALRVVCKEPHPALDFCANISQVFPCSHAELTYKVWLPEDFDYGSGGNLPGFSFGCKSQSNLLEGACFPTWTGEGQAHLHVKSGSSVPPPLPLRKGGWNVVRVEVKLNTPRCTDGFIIFGINGREGRVDGVVWRESPRCQLQQLAFQMHFHTAPAKSQEVRFSDFIISSKSV
jgi:hypothetical protein